MARRPEGHKIRWKRGWAYVRFTHQKVKHDIALGTKDPDEAASLAAREYADVVSGRRRPIARNPSTSLSLDELLAEWIAAQEGSLDSTTLKTLVTYARHYVAFFRTFDRITEASGGDYGRERLRCVLRDTVRKELSFLRGFLAWCVEQGVLSSAPEIPPLKKKATGVRSGPQRARPVNITGTEALAIISKLPEMSKTIGGRKWPIRARFRFAWETSLRPATIAILEVPKHWRHGSRELTLDDADDKARFGRTIDLSPEACAILEEVAPRLGVIFGRHGFQHPLKNAASVILGEERGRQFAAYDFRHARARHLLDNGASLRGVAYVLGHKRISTTDKYLDADREEGKKAIRGPFEAHGISLRGKNS